MIALKHLPLLSVLLCAGLPPRGTEAASAQSADHPPPPPDSISVTFSEKALDLNWSAVDGADGYNLYTAPTSGLPKNARRLVNTALITSGTHFTYIWDVEGKERTRAIKGRRHYLAIAAVALEGSTQVEGVLSHEVDNDYFEGYQQMNRPSALEAILQSQQHTDRLPVAPGNNKKADFIAFMKGPGASLQKVARDSLDFREIGACVPLTTVLVQLMRDHDLRAWKIEGTFIKEFHSFALIAVAGVEYVVDVTADQFIPGVGPVVVPRDRCFLNQRGRFDTQGTPVYQVGKVYHSDSTSLVEGQAGERFRRIADAVRRRYPPNR